MKFYGTFGFGQVNEGKYVEIDAKTREEAHEKMFEAFDDKWSFLYNEKGWMVNDKTQAEEYHLIKLQNL